MLPREEEVDLSLLPEDCRDIDSQAFVDAVFALHQQPYEGLAQEEAHLTVRAIKRGR